MIMSSLLLEWYSNSISFQFDESVNKDYVLWIIETVKVKFESILSLDASRQGPKTCALRQDHLIPVHIHTCKKISVFVDVCYLIDR